MCVPLPNMPCPNYLKLKEKWFNCSREDNEEESQEVVEDHLTRQLTKEYLDLLVNITHEKKTIETTDEMGEEEVVQTPVNPREESLSMLGQMCIRNEV